MSDREGFLIALILDIGQMYWVAENRAWHARREDATLYATDTEARDVVRGMRREDRIIRVVSA